MQSKILTSHAGSLPRTDELLAANAARRLQADGFTLERTPEFESLLAAAVLDLVRKQRDIGIDIVGDGEFGKAMSSAVDYGAWWSYSFQRVAGLTVTGEDIFNTEPSDDKDGKIKLSTFAERRDRLKFSDAYNDPESGIGTGKQVSAFPATTGPLEYRGQDAIASDIENLKAALAETGSSEGFLTSLSPGSGARIVNRHYATEEEHIWAWAEVMREEYQAIVDAGLTLQIDDPSIAENFDQINPEPSIEDYREFTQIRVDALNWAIRGLPEEQIRFHLCWGSWHGPHTTDIEFRHIIDLMLQINAGSYSFEAANVRHEHEWKIWQDHKLPEGKKILPGIVSHATNVVEHPELVADRIERFAGLVGPEHVIASTDCGLGGRIHPQIAHAKLQSLAQGAQIASQRLYR